MKKLQIILGITAAVCVLSLVVSTLVIGGISGQLVTRDAVGRWASDGTLTAHLSAFYSTDATVTSQTVERSFTDALDKALTEASISPKNERARLYAYTYSAETVGTVTFTDEWGKAQKGSVNAAVTACGADYFIFNSVELLSGQYFKTDDILNDCVIIDNDIAWQFFGSFDVVGRTLKLNGRDVTISGVSVSGRDSEFPEYYGERPRIYISYSLAEEMFGEMYVTAVETLLPNPVGGFAFEMFKNALPSLDGASVFIESSERFSDMKLLENLKSFMKLGVRTDSVSYPYYENTAIELANIASVVYIFKLVPLVLLALMIVCELVILYIKRRVIVSAVTSAVGRRVRDIKMNRRHKSESIKKVRSEKVRTKKVRTKKERPQKPNIDFDDVDDLF